MYAIINKGSKQYRVKKGDIIDVELLSDSNIGEKVEFKEVLFFSDGKTQKVGTPHVKCTVLGEYLDDVKGEKKISYKYKRRKNYRLKKGSRPTYARIKITDIKAA